VIGFDAGFDLNKKYVGIGVLLQLRRDQGAGSRDRRGAPVAVVAVSNPGLRERIEVTAKPQGR